MSEHASQIRRLSPQSTPSVILVLGMHRSGTSAFTRTLNLMGASLPDNLVPAKPDNAAGFWESADVQALNDRILQALGSRWDDWRALPLGDLPEPDEAAFMDEACTILRTAFAESPLIVLKDPRICRLLPFWRQALTRVGARVSCLLTVRSPDAVAASLARRDRLPVAASYSLWMRHLLDAERFSRGLPRAVVDYDTLIEDWRGAVTTIESALAMKFPVATEDAGPQIDQFLRRELRHHTAAGAQELPGELTEALAHFNVLSDSPHDAAATGQLDGLRDAFEHQCALMNPPPVGPFGVPLAGPHELPLARVPPHSPEAGPALRMSAAAAAHARSTLEAIGLQERFSVIMPTWNRVETLSRAIDSVLAQSVPPLELIICDDGSTDGTAALLRERYGPALAQGLIRHLSLEHRGVSAARNAGLREAQGEWIAYLDSDNSWHPDYLLMVAAAFLRNPHRRTAYACEHVHDLINKRNFISWLPFNWQRLLLDNYIDINIFAHYRTVHSQMGGFDEGLGRLEDWDLILRYTRVYPPQFIPTVLCDYFLDRGDHLTVTESLDTAKAIVRRKFAEPAAGRPPVQPVCLVIKDSPDPAPALLPGLNDIAADVIVYASNKGEPQIPPDMSVRQPADSASLEAVLQADASDATTWMTTLRWSALVARDVFWRAKAAEEHRHLTQQVQKLERDFGSQAKNLTRIQTALTETRSTLKATEATRIRAQKSARAFALRALRQQRALLRGRKHSGQRPPPRLCFGVKLGIRDRLGLWRKARRLLASGLFDPLWYLQTAPDVAADSGNPIWHWLVRGWKEGRQPNPLFDAKWYFSRYADVAHSGCDPLEHYLDHGAAEGRDPGPLFSTRWYLEQNADVAAAGINPLVHYLVHGQREGRRPNRWFDPRAYLELNPDVAAANFPPLEHYLLAGGREGRPSGPAFDADWYLTRYPDVRGEDIHPLAHYLTHGIREGRQPTPNRPATPERRPPAPAQQLRLDSPDAQALQLDERQITEARRLVAAANIGMFSVVMPTWNRAAIIGRAIDSVIAQSYPDWELIVCDDGSDDGTEAMIHQRYADWMKSGRLRYLRLPHAGVCAARNAGLHAAKGPWIAYLDSDNAWRPDYLLMIAAAYATRPEHRAAYACLQVRHEPGDREFIRYSPFDFGSLLARNYIDLNIFSHHRDLYRQLGGFDETLKRLVDWDLILRYTQSYAPLFVPFVLCDYFIDKALNNITLTEALAGNERVVRRKFATRLVGSGAAPPRIAYVLWDWPALSQTFVLEEVRELRRRQIDVRVYYVIDPDKAARDLPDVEATRVADADELADALVADARNWIHGHFAQRTVRDLVWPAAEKTGIAFSFMAHAIDIFPHRSRKSNRIAEVTSSAMCARVVVHGEYHRHFLIEHGVPPAKIIMTPQAVDTGPIRSESIAPRTRAAGTPLRVLTIARFVEKKGLEFLVDAAGKMRKGSVEVRIFGYGPLEDAYRAQIRKLGLESSVSLRGAFEGADALREALAWADVFCLPCVEAQDGDTDGMPTVFFEAMAAGVPCVGTTVSAIPDFIANGITGFLVPPRDAKALASRLSAIAAMPQAALAAVARAARDWTDEHLGARHTVDALLDVCAHPPLDIFMVTYHRDGHGSWAATERAIRSVLEHTTTPMLLTVVDNGSDDAFLEKLQVLARGDERIRIVPLGGNRLCGPASNVALSMARSEFVFYVCSNEGYVTRTGWERPCLRYMRNHPDVALAGHLVASPAWPDGRAYTAQPWFTDFRNPEFAEGQPDREFFHVQGGLYVLRRSVFEKEGGFSDRRPQAQTDVEYSYFLESRGYRLGDIPELVVLSNKTRPGIEAFVDEHTVAIHPVFDETVPMLRAWSQPGHRRCNICGWSGTPSLADDDVSFDCPKCSSSPRDRAAFRWLAGSNLHHRGKSLNAGAFGTALRERLRPMFASLDDENGIAASDIRSAGASLMLGIPPALDESAAPPQPSARTTAPRCNICGGDVFGPGPGGRKAVNGASSPGCRSCGSLERHRAFRAALSSLRDATFASLRVLQFSQDAAVDSAWFAEHEASIYGGRNSLDLQAIDRPDASYDLVICNHVLEHVADDRAALLELFRVLRPGGFIFLSVPDPLRLEATRDWGHPDARQHGHYRIYGRDFIDKLVSVLPHASMSHITVADPVTHAPESCFLICKGAVELQVLMARLDGFEREQITPPTGATAN